MAKAFDWARDERILDRRFVLPTSHGSYGNYSQPAITTRRFFTQPTVGGRRPLSLLSSHDVGDVISPRSAMKHPARYGTDAVNIRYTCGGWYDKGNSLMRGSPRNMYLGGSGLGAERQGLGSQGLVPPQRSSSPSRFIPAQASVAVHDLPPGHSLKPILCSRWGRPSSQEPRLFVNLPDCERVMSDRGSSDGGPSRKAVGIGRADTPKVGDRPPAFFPSPHYRNMDRPRSMDQPPKPIHVASRSLHPTIEPPLAQDLSGCKTPESFGESTNDTHWLPDPFKQHYVKVRGCSKGRLDLLLAKLHYFGFFVLDIQIRRSKVYVRVHGGPTEKQRLLDMKYLYIEHEFDHHRSKLTLSDPSAALSGARCTVLLPNHLQVPARKTLSMMGLILATLIKKFFSVLFSEPV